MADPEKPVAVPKDPAIQKALDEISVVKARADARKAEADAEAAGAAARTATFKAVWGEIPAAPYSGEVKENDGAALAEQNHLVGDALAKIALKIGQQIKQHAKGKNVYLTGDASVPSVGAAQTFDLQKDLVTRALDDAISVSGKLDAPVAAAEEEAGDFVPLAVIGLALTSLSAVLSYAKTDYALGGRTLVPSGTAMLGLIGDYLVKEHKQVCLAPFVPLGDPVARKDLIDEFAAVSTIAAEARERAANHASRIKALSPKDTKPAPTHPGAAAALASADAAIAEKKPVPANPGASASPASPDPDPNNEKPLHEHALAALTPALALFDAMQTALLTVTDGVSGGQRILEARAISAFMSDADAIVAIVAINGAFASTLSEKGLFSSVGGSIPYKISTYLEANWRCVNASTMLLLGSGNERIFSPLKKISDIE